MSEIVDWRIEAVKKVIRGYVLGSRYSVKSHRGTTHICMSIERKKLSYKQRRIKVTIEKGGSRG